SSIATTITANVVATLKFAIKNGNVCPIPPAVVINPITSPRIHGDPRPVNDPSSDKDSANPIEIPAPSEAASPTRNASQLLCVATAAANRGASVDTDPSINPASPGCTTCSRNSFFCEASSAALALIVRCYSPSAPAVCVCFLSSSANLFSNSRVDTSV